MWLRDVLNWEMMCCELRRARVTAKPVRRPFQCAVQPWDARHKKTTESPYYSEIQSTTPYYKVRLCTTPYYKVRFRTSKLGRLTPCSKVLLCTTKYYSSTTSYYKHYAVLQSTTKYYSVLRRSTKYYKYLPRTSEMSSTLHRASYETQSTMEIRHSYLIVATLELWGI